MRTIKIGEQIWMLDNLDVTTYRNGDPIPMVEDAEEWKNTKSGAWCYFGNTMENNLKYGKIYNCYAVTDSRGLAPEGFKIPEHYDWLLLQKFANQLKDEVAWKEHQVADNCVSFNSKLGGYRSNNGIYCDENSVVGWWAFPESDVNNQGNIAHWLHKNEAQLGWKPFFENYGFYVRCIKEKSLYVDFHFNENLQLPFTTVSVKYSTATTFQEVLNLLYGQFLKEKVSSYSYGKEWIIQIYDGEGLFDLYKPGDEANRSLISILKSLFCNSYRIIIAKI